MDHDMPPPFWWTLSNKITYFSILYFKLAQIISLCQNFSLNLFKSPSCIFIGFCTHSFNGIGSWLKKIIAWKNQVRWKKINLNLSCKLDHKTHEQRSVSETNHKQQICGFQVLIQILHKVVDLPIFWRKQPPDL